MTFAFPVPSISLAARFGLLALALTLFGLGGACEDKHVGRPCEPGIRAATGGTSGGGMRSPRWSSPALECPSRICIAARRREGSHGGADPAARAPPALHGRLRGER